jgi:SAM-dependent methyltransferase
MENNVPTKKPKSHFAGKYFEEIDELPEQNNYFVPVLNEVAKSIDWKTARILDVGCGTGLFLVPVIAAGCNDVFGVDGPSEFESRALKRGYREVKTVPDLNRDPLPFPDQTFDLIVSKDVFEHLMDPLFVLSEIRRVLKPGGMFLFHVPNHFPLGARLKFLFANDIDTFSYFMGESRWTFPHVRFYEQSDSLATLRQNGFTVRKDLSWLFASLPVLSRISLFKPVLRRLAVRYPNQFAAGYTYLLDRED